ncbi:exopolyphosphatase [Aquabacterium fontiphilum]|jgi:exopolyphosphatase/guanosine-5'-triphosphate,3'-diphosphate pyrophosphatase|nr:exopolyphosphatase [Aquabacterium fontiphilum]
MDKPLTPKPSKTQAALSGSRFPHLLAAIDMGSNSFRLEIAELSRGRYKRVDYLKETVRLGGGLDVHGLLTEEATQRGLACLARFAQRLKGFAAWQVRAVATQTLREARNRDAFLARANRVLGHPIEVVSGREEARLIFQGVSRLQPSDLPRLVIDIGGRSTEMILGQGRQAHQAESFGVGSVSLSLQHFPGGRFTATGFRAAQIAAGAEFEEALGTFDRALWQEALGSSGTVGAVSQILAASGVTDGTITAEALRWCIERCIEAGSMEDLQLPGLKPDRKAVLGGGLSILYTLLQHFRIEALRPAKGALRQGVIFDLEERLDAVRNHRLPDPRDLSVRELQSRFRVDAAQADRVRQRALLLWHSLAHPQARPDGEDARELGWAAALHEIGMMVSHHDHHRHSAYLLGHVDAPGFSQSQLRQLAVLVLGQRGELTKLVEHLGDDALMSQVLCLRLAIILHHARIALPARATALQRQRGRVVLSLSRRWAQEHPRTLHLLDEECRRWLAQANRRIEVQLT